MFPIIIFIRFSACIPLFFFLFLCIDYKYTIFLAMWDIELSFQLPKIETLNMQNVRVILNCLAVGLFEHPSILWRKKIGSKSLNTKRNHMKENKL